MMERREPTHSTTFNHPQAESHSNSVRTSPTTIHGTSSVNPSQTPHSTPSMLSPVLNITRVRIRPRLNLTHHPIRLVSTQTDSKPVTSLPPSNPLLTRNRTALGIPPNEPLPSNGPQISLESHKPTNQTSSYALPPHFASNQQVPVSSELSEQLKSILKTFKAPIRYAIAYGSGVFLQKSYDHNKDKPMLDLIIAASHPSHWHSINLQQNPHHYALPARWFGSGGISWLQERGPGAGVWFNVDNEINGRRIKYGVISVDTLCDDLLDWKTLYVSGRMQKPTHILRDDARVRLAQQVNLASALRTALLLLPGTFNEHELYRSIAGLSYTGDFRMRWGENPRKVDNIVLSQLEQFRGLYRPLIRALRRHLSYKSQGEGIRTLEQDMSPRSRAEILQKLPITLREKIETDYNQRWNLELATHPDGSKLINSSEKLTSTDEINLLSKIGADEGFDECLKRGVGLIVSKPTMNQSLKGILSAGPTKSIRYAIPKLLKRWKSSSS